MEGKVAIIGGHSSSALAGKVVEELKERGIEIINTKDIVPDGYINAYNDVLSTLNEFSLKKKRKNNVQLHRIDTIPKVVIPKGCKYWYFNKQMEIVSKDDYYFKCIASNFKQAKRKFEKNINQIDK
jgi:hypothetical protein